MKTCLLPALLSLATLTLSGCLPGESGDVSALQDKIDSLQKEVDALRTMGDSGSGDPVASGKMEELTQRVSDIESARGQMQATVTQQIKDQNVKLSRMFNDFNEMHEMVVTGQTWAAFGIGYQGHVVARTPHGSFLVELVTQEKVPEGYRLKLRIGNTTGLHVHQFRMYGEFGSPPPDHTKTKDYAEFIDSTERWEGSLKQFDVTFMTPLEPDRWTDIGLTIPAEKLTELQFIRFRMAVEQAQLEKSAYDESFVVTGIDSQAVPLLKTPQGTFPLDIRDSRPTGSGYEVDFYIGNPFTMVVKNSRMIIRYGKARPAYDESMDPAEYRNKLVEWNRSLKLLDQSFGSDVMPFHWNLLRVNFPTQNREELAFMECRWEILNISLRNPE